MEEIKQEHGLEQINKSEDTIVYIRNDPVMQSAIDLLPILGNKKRVILRAVGNSIPNAVAVANIITEKMMHGNSKVEKIKLDTEAAAGIGSMTSNIEIILIKF
ncbi:MAG: DNA-binding protein [Nitrosopumilus sp.]|nr:DNA-binding protein [Nitrosopumilus sp.]